MKFDQIIFVVGFALYILIIYLLLKNDLDENKRLTKRGFVKFFIILAIGSPLFLLIMRVVNVYLN